MSVAVSVDCLRFVTYLAPSIPEAFYRGLAELLSTRLGIDAVLDVDARRSGPQAHGEDPFTSGAADVGFMCAPCYVDLCRLDTPSVELLVAPVYDDPRNQGRPVYFSEVVVRREARPQSFRDLEGGSWAYNDLGSLSGYHAMLGHLRGHGHDDGFFRRAVHSGSHLASMELVAQGDVDVAAIDANVLSLQLGSRPELMENLRILLSLGPHPVQPVVARRGLPSGLKARLRDALLGLAAEPDGASHLAQYRVSRFVRVEHDDYAPSSWSPVANSSG